MSHQHNEDQRDIAAASSAAAAFQEADNQPHRSSYFPGPSSRNMHTPNLPNLASHANASLFFPSAVSSTMEQVSFVMGIRSILEEADNDISPDKFLEQMREVFPPSRLLHPTVLRDGGYHKQLRTLMERLGIDLVEHPPGVKRLISRWIAYTIYAGDEYEQEREVADSLLSSYRTYNPITGSHSVSGVQSPTANYGFMPTAGTSQPPPPPRSNKPYKDMVHAFKDRSAKYGGELDQNWADNIQQYDTTADIAELTPEDKLRCLPLMLRDDALTHFTVHVKPVAQDYEQACQLLSRRFHGRSRQMRIKSKLLSLNIQQFHEEGQDLDVTVTKLSSFIQKNFPLVPSTFQCEDNKIDILLKAVRLQPWADTAIQSLESAAISYESFLSKLSYGLQTYLDTQKLRGNESPTLTGDSFSVNFQHGHARYGNPTTPSRRPFSRHDSDQQCWNCGRSNFRVSRCSQPLNPKRIAANRLNWLSRSRLRGKPSMEQYKRVLLEFADEIDGMLQPHNPPAHLMSSADVDTFFTVDKPDEEEERNDSDSEQDSNLASVHIFDTLQSAASGHHAEVASIDADEGF